MFGRNPETGDRVLVSLGKDMKMNEYDLETSGISEGLMLSARYVCTVFNRLYSTLYSQDRGGAEVPAHLRHVASPHPRSGGIHRHRK